MSLRVRVHVVAKLDEISNIFECDDGPVHVGCLWLCGGAVAGTVPNVLALNSFISRFMLLETTHSLGANERKQCSYSYNVPIPRCEV